MSDDEDRTPNPRAQMPTWGWVALSVALTGSGGTIVTSMGTFDLSNIDPIRLALVAAVVFVAAIVAGVGFLIYTAIAHLGAGALEIHTILAVMGTKIDAFERMIAMTQQGLHVTWNSGRLTGIERTLKIPTPDFPTAAQPPPSMIGDRRVGDSTAALRPVPDAG